MNGVYFFKKQDFELFEPNKWSSKKFNGKRLMLKERLKNFTLVLKTKCPDLSEYLDMEIGTEFPTLWNSHKVDRLELFFLRNKEVRNYINTAMSREIPISVLLESPSQLYAHASLGLILDHNGISVGLRVPYLAIADKENLREFIKQHQEEIEKLLKTDQYDLKCGLSNQEECISTSDCSGTYIVDKLNELEQKGQKEHRLCFEITRNFKISNDIYENSAEIDLIIEILNFLWNFYKKFAWSKDNDLIDIASLIKAQKIISEQLKLEDLEQIKKQQANEKDRKLKEQLKKDELLKKLSNIKQTPKKQKYNKEKDKRFNSQRANKKDYKRKKEPYKFKGKSNQSNNRYRTDSSFQKGDKVKIVTGLLSGQEAVVQEISSNKVKVVVNGLTVNLEFKDIKKI